MANVDMPKSCGRKKKATQKRKGSANSAPGATMTFPRVSRVSVAKSTADPKSIADPNSIADRSFYAVPRFRHTTTASIPLTSKIASDG